MASIRKRGDTYTITAYMGYDESGKQRKKTNKENKAYRVNFRDL